MRNVFILLGVGLALSPMASAQRQAQDPIKRVARVAYQPAGEISGIVKSRTYPDVYWVHNDSGDEARIFPITGKGQIIIPPWKVREYYGEVFAAGKKLWPGHRISLAANYDWEDIALADGKLYIADLGNNGNGRRDLGIYVLNEPNPRASSRARILTWWPVRYPEQKRYPAEKWHFDCESIFIFDGKPYLLTKHRVAGQLHRAEVGTRLYRLDTTHTDRENVLTLVDTHPSIGVWPTGADLSPDGKRLAVLTQTEIWIFERPVEGDRWLSGRARRIKLPYQTRTKQAEAICWENATTLRFANEQWEIFQVPLEAFQPVPEKGH